MDFGAGPPEMLCRPRPVHRNFRYGYCEAADGHGNHHGQQLLAEFLAIEEEERRDDQQGQYVSVAQARRDAEEGRPATARESLVDVYEKQFVEAHLQYRYSDGTRRIRTRFSLLGHRVLSKTR